MLRRRAWMQRLTTRAALGVGTATLAVMASLISAALALWGDGPPDAASSL